MSEQETRGANEAIDFNDELRNRREKLAALRQQGVAFPNDFRRDHTSDQLHEEFDAKDNQDLESLNIEVSVAGRMMTRRIMGKASFFGVFYPGKPGLFPKSIDFPASGTYNDGEICERERYFYGTFLSDPGATGDAAGKNEPLHRHGS